MAEASHQGRHRRSPVTSFRRASSTSSVTSSSFHEQIFPMWVVSVLEVLRMSCPIQPHEQLRELGQVILHELSFYTIFISHQWLGRRHPDPEGRQLSVLQHVLRACISGSLPEDSDIVHSFFFGSRTLSTDERKAIGDGYIWLDWFCVPQDAHAQAKRLRAIQSIPSYIDSCSLFIALVPPLPDESGEVCDFESWLGRGWCLAELWCAQMANGPKAPMIAVHSEDDASFCMTMHWIYLPPHEGNFSVEADRGAVQSMVQISIQARIAYLEESQRDPALRRYLKGRLHDWHKGAEPVPQSESAAFLSHFGFRSLAEGLKCRDVGALVCAVLLDNMPMVRRLVEAKASMNRRCRPMPSVDVMTWTPLHFAVQRGSHALPMVAELLRLKGDPNATDALGCPLVGNSRDAATVEFLIQNRANINLRTGLAMVSPLQQCCAKVQPVEAVAKLLEMRAAVNPTPRGGLGRTPLADLAFFSAPVQCKGVELATLLVNARADVNASGHSGGLFRVLEMGSRAAVMLGKRSALAQSFANTSSSALGLAAMSGNAQMVSFLLAAKADPDLPNSRGRSPRQLAGQRIQYLFAEGLCKEFDDCLLNSNEWDLPTEYTPKYVHSRSVRGSKGLLSWPSSSSLVEVRL